MLGSDEPVTTSMQDSVLGEANSSDVDDDHSSEVEVNRQTPPTFPTLEEIPPPEDLVSRGQYLIDCPSWQAYLGEEKRNEYPKHFVSRNDKIWELIFTEVRYVDLLVVIRDVFSGTVSTNGNDSFNVKDTLFPCVDDLLEGHRHLLYRMLEAHNSGEHHITESLGRSFVDALTPKTQDRLTEAYGTLMFTQSSLTDRLNKIKANAKMAEKLSEWEKDPRTKRRTVTDCYMIIIQRWTKIETLLVGIISDTTDTTEYDDLNACRRVAQRLLLGAQQTMTDLVHAEKLHFLALHLREDWEKIEDGSKPHQSLRERMEAADAKLINYDKLKVLSRKESGKPYNIEVHGVALTDCFFLLREDPDTGLFSLFQDADMPPILIWKTQYGYFRDQAGSPLTFMLIMDNNDKEPTLKVFTCATNDEVARWQKVFTAGFDSFCKVDEEKMESVLLKNNRELEDLELRKKRQKDKLRLISQLTEDIFSQWDIRNKAFRVLFVDESPAKSTSSSTSTVSAGQDQYQRQTSANCSSEAQQNDDDCKNALKLHTIFLNKVLRLQNFLETSVSTNLSRSSSDVAERRLSCGVTSPSTIETSSESYSRQRSEKESSSLRAKAKTHHRWPSRLNSNEPQSRISNFLRSGSRGKGENGRRPDVTSDTQGDESIIGLGVYEGASNSSLATLYYPFSLVADIQDLACNLLEIYDLQLRHSLALEKEVSHLKSEADIAGRSSLINAKRELENLRSLQRKTASEQKEWNLQKQKEIAKLEVEEQKLQNLAKTLEEKEKLLEERSQTLQISMDLCALNGVDVGPLGGANRSSSGFHHCSPPADVGRTPSNLSQGNLPRAEGDAADPGERVRRFASNESLNARQCVQPPAANRPEGESTSRGGISKPPTSPRIPVGEPTKKTSSSTLGTLPTKLASKSRSTRSFLRH